jgi:hypothetical protein
MTTQFLQNATDLSFAPEVDGFLPSGRGQI